MLYLVQFPFLATNEEMTEEPLLEIISTYNGNEIIDKMFNYCNILPERGY